MGRSTTDRAFARFVRRGDAADLGAVFDAAAPELARVAGHVVRDGVEDLVQETFLIAIERRATWDPRRPVVPWLLGILLNLARRRRGARTLDTLDAEPADAHGHGPGETAAEVELGQTLRAAVRSLPPRYRDVLIAHVERGEPAVEIARRRGCSASTVRNQVMRGLELLRRAVPAGALGAAVVAGRAFELDAARAAVLAAGERAPSLAPGAAGAVAASSPWLIGSLTMTKLTLSAAAAVAALAIGLAVWNSDAAAPAHPISPGGPLAVDDVAEAAPATTAPAAGGSPQRKPADGPAVAALASSASIDAAALAVEVRFDDGDDPAVDLGLLLQSDSGPSLGVERRTDGLGRARFVLDELPPAARSGALTLHTDRGHSLPVRFPETGEQQVELVIPYGTRIVGEVVDWRGDTVPGARIYSTRAAHAEGLQLVARCDDDGRFEVRDAGRNTSLLARASGHQPSRIHGIVGSSEEAAEELRGIQLRLGAPGYRLHGRVEDERGRPIPSALVAVAVDEDTRDLTPGAEYEHFVELQRRAAAGETDGDRALDMEAILLRCDAHGRFASDEIPRGEALILARGPLSDSAVLAVERIFVDDDRAQPLVLVAGSGAAVRGRVVDRAGRGQPGLRLMSEWDGADGLAELEHDLGQRVASRTAITDADGSFLLAGMLPGEHDIHIEAQLEQNLDFDTDLAVDRESIELGADETRSLEIVLDRLVRARLEVLANDGQPLAGWGVRLGDQAPAALPRQVTDADGRVTCHPVPAGPTTVCLFQPAGSHRFDPLPAAVLEVDLNEDRQTLTVAAMPDLALTGRLLHWDGAPMGRAILDLARVGVARDSNADNVRLALAEEDGRFTLAHLAPGEYTLGAERGRGPHTDFGTVLLSDGDLDLGDLVVVPQAPLRVTVAGGRGLDARLTRVDGDGPVPVGSGRRLRADGDALVSEPIGAGTFALWVTADDGASLLHTFDVDPVAESEPRLSVTLEAARPVRLLAGPDGPLGDVGVRLRRILDGREYDLGHVPSELLADRGGRPTATLDLPPGRYAVQLRHDRQQVAIGAASFEVGPGDGALEVELERP